MKARVNQRFEFEITSPEDMRVTCLGEDRYQIVQNDRNVELEVLTVDIRAKTCSLIIDGFVLEVHLEDELDDVLRQIRQLTGPDSGDVVVTAPIPGLIKSVHVDDGQNVDEGDVLVVLEAMKMENFIQAPGAADRLQLHVSEGERVVKGQQLCTLYQS